MESTTEYEKKKFEPVQIQVHLVNGKTLSGKVHKLKNLRLSDHLSLPNPIVTLTHVTDGHECSQYIMIPKTQILYYVPVG